MIEEENPPPDSSDTLVVPDNHNVSFEDNHDIGKDGVMPELPDQTVSEPVGDPIKKKGRPKGAPNKPVV